jgi:tRNA A37 methylthiotransferase MiaB
MNRIYKKEDLIKLFGTLKEMGFTNYDTHIIVGFPTEQEKDIFDTVNFIVEYNLNYVLVSRYMEVLSAPSAKINDKILKKDIDSRVKIVEDIFTKNNIIYNTNESDLMREQIRRLNL